MKNNWKSVKTKVIDNIMHEQFERQYQWSASLTAPELEAFTSKLFMEMFPGDPDNISDFLAGVDWDYLVDKYLPEPELLYEEF